MSLDQVTDFYVHALFFPPAEMDTDLYRPATPETKTKRGDIVECAWGSEKAFIQWMKILMEGSPGKKERTDRLTRTLVITFLWYAGLGWSSFFSLRDMSDTAIDSCPLPPVVLRLTEGEMIPSRSNLVESLKATRHWLLFLLRHCKDLKWCTEYMPTDAQIKTAVSQLTQTLANCGFTCYVPPAPSQELRDIVVRVTAKLQYAVFRNNGGVGDAYFAHPLLTEKPLWRTPAGISDADRIAFTRMSMKWMGIVTQHAKPEDYSDVTTLVKMCHHGMVHERFLRRWAIAHGDKMIFRTPPDWRIWRILMEGPTDADIEASPVMQRLASMRGGPIFKRPGCTHVDYLYRPVGFLEALTQRCASGLIAACCPRPVDILEPGKRVVVNSAFSRHMPTPPQSPATSAHVLPQSLMAMHARVIKSVNPSARGKVQSQCGDPEMYQRLIIYMQATLFNGFNRSLSHKFMQKLEGQRWVFREWGLTVAEGVDRFSAPLCVQDLKPWWKKQKQLILDVFANKPLVVWGAEHTAHLYTDSHDRRTPEFAAQLRASLLQSNYQMLCYADASDPLSVIRWATSVAPLSTYPAHPVSDAASPSADALASRRRESSLCEPDSEPRDIWQDDVRDSH